MRSLAFILLITGLSHALPQDVCATQTVQVIAPTKIATYTTYPVVTIHATTARDLGTFTEVTTLSTTTTLETITATVGSCEVSGTVTFPQETSTVYSQVNPDSASSKRGVGLSPRDCTVIVTSTTTYGQTHVWITGSSTSTYTAYTTFKQETVTSTQTGGKAYAIATEIATTMQTCGESTVTESSATHTITLDPRCSPSAMVSAYYNYGIEWLSDTPIGGATYETNSTDASACCQLCAEAGSCAASAWDIRTGKCQLEFPVSPDSGTMNCGQGLLGYYDAGPNHPMSPGTGWFVAEVCGNVQFGAAKPDDGS